MVHWSGCCAILLRDILPFSKYTLTLDRLSVPPNKTFSMEKPSISKSKSHQAVANVFQLNPTTFYKEGINKRWEKIVCDKLVRF